MATLLALSTGAVAGEEVIGDGKDRRSHLLSRTGPMSGDDFGNLLRTFIGETIDAKSHHDLAGPWRAIAYAQAEHEHRWQALSYAAALEEVRAREARLPRPEPVPSVRAPGGYEAPGDVSGCPYRHIGAQYDWAYGLDWWCWVVDEESGHDPYAVGSAGERGLLQIHPVHFPYVRSLGYTVEQLYDPHVNVHVAWLISGGTCTPWAWSC